MRGPHYPVLLDHQLLSSRLGSIEQPHVDKFNVPAFSSLPVEDIIIWYGVSLEVKVYLLFCNVKFYFLQVVLELKRQ